MQSGLFVKEGVVQILAYRLFHGTDRTVKKGQDKPEWFVLP